MQRQDKRKPAPKKNPGKNDGQDKENLLGRLVREDPEKAAQLLRDYLSRK